MTQSSQIQSSPGKLVYSPKGELSTSSEFPSVKACAIELWDTVSDRKTGIIYKEAFLKTWDLLKQAIFLILSFFFLVFALIIWLWGMAFNLGRESYQKLEPILGSNSSEPQAILSSIFKWLLWLIWLPMRGIILRINPKLQRLGLASIDTKTIDDFVNLTDTQS